MGSTAMKKWLLQIFTWWHGQTLGTRFLIWRRGRAVGEDAMGNRYYESRDKTRRWVIYAHQCEASAIPPGWHGWMHHRRDTPPVDEHGNDTYTARPWEEHHQSNPTGSATAYRPAGSLARGGLRDPQQRNYEPWSPIAPDESNIS